MNKDIEEFEKRWFKTWEQSGLPDETFITPGYAFMETLYDFVKSEIKLNMDNEQRIRIASMAMQGMLANSYSDGVTQPLSSATNEQLADMAVQQADALICRLKKE